jgi:FkbM family methyltransferase
MALERTGMLRQIRNLMHLGRLRTTAPTPRARKPDFLREHPESEVDDILSMAVASLGRAPQDFFFVQIGAFDGRMGDPLYRLVTRNRWRGVLVEPQAEAFEQLRQNYAGHPQLQFFNVAVGSFDGEVTFYTRKSGSVQHASVRRHLLITPGHGAGEILERKVPCWTPGTLLAHASAPASIDLLQIDTEGHDYEIIRAIDFARVKPTIIRFEHQLLSRHDFDAALRLLAAQGYRFLLEDRDTTAILRGR